MRDTVVHHMNPLTYHVPCGDGDKIFNMNGPSDGASIYKGEVTCPKCIKLITDPPDQKEYLDASMDIGMY